jgi:sugar phosphate isomerase/epimerase
MSATNPIHPPLMPSIWTAIYLNRPIVDALKSLLAAGWRCFELSTEHLQEIEDAPNPQALIDELRDTLAQHGACMPQAHSYLPANVAHPDEERRRSDLQRLQRNLRTCALLGVRDVVVHPGVGAGYSTSDGLASILSLNVQAFSLLASQAADLGLRIAIENMMDGRSLEGSRAYCASIQELLDLVAEVGHPSLGVTLDTSHANVQRISLPAAIQKLGSLLWCTHISDNDGSGDQHRCPGYGKIDWPPVVVALRKVCYPGALNLEIPGERTAPSELLDLKVRHALEVTTWLAHADQGPFSS